MLAYVEPKNQINHQLGRPLKATDKKISPFFPGQTS